MTDEQRVKALVCLGTAMADFEGHPREQYLTGFMAGAAAAAWLNQKLDGFTDMEIGNKLQARIDELVAGTTSGKKPSELGDFKPPHTAEDN